MKNIYLRSVGPLFGLIVFMSSCNSYTCFDPSEHFQIYNQTDTVIIELKMPDFFNERQSAKYNSDYIPNGSNVILFFNEKDSSLFRSFNNESLEKQINFNQDCNTNESVDFFELGTELFDTSGIANISDIISFNSQETKAELNNNNPDKLYSDIEIININDSSNRIIFFRESDEMKCRKSDYAIVVLDSFIFSMTYYQINHFNDLKFSIVRERLKKIRIKKY